MRAVKFRGKQINGCEWLYGYYFAYDSVSDNQTYHSIVPGKYSCKPVEHFHVAPETVGQFTGLKDCKGVEIYEGDIISVNGKYPKLVRYINEYACFCLANLSDLNQKWMQPWQQVSPGWWNDFNREILIVGNEHDTPEMIPKK